MRNKKYKSWVIFSDQHVPYHDKIIHQAFLDFLKDFNPDGLVLAGDFMDMRSVSRHNIGLLDFEEATDPNNKHIIRLKKEFDTANSVLDDYDSIISLKCEKHFISGNHEHRLDRWLQNAFNGVLEGLVSVEQNLMLKERGYIYHGNYPRGRMNIGKLTITHGKFTNIHLAANLVNKYRQSIAAGHAHTSQMIYVGGLGVQQVGIAIGHGADLNSIAMNYMDDSTARWVHGWLIVYEEIKTGKFWPYLLNFYDRRLFYNGKLYGK